jgi:hypothetical protein
LPFGPVLAPLAFTVANLVLLFSGWAVVWKLIVAIIIGFALLAISAVTSPPDRRPQIDWASGVWLWPYLIGMGTISYLSSFDTATPSHVPLLGLHGPTNKLPFGWDVLVVALLSAAIYVFAMRVRLPAARTHEYVGDLTAEAEAIEGELEGGAP